MNPKHTKIVFFGTPHFAAAILRKLSAEKYDIAAVLTQSDKRTGRKQEMKKSPVKIWAEKNGLPIFSPRDSKEMEEIVVQARPDVIVVAAFGKILPKSVLDVPKYGSLNIHASLLPKFRGASPVQQAILEGEKETGVSVMLMNERLDAGEIISQEKIKIDEKEDARTLTEKLVRSGAGLLAKTLPGWISGKIKSAPQDEKKASYCRTVKKEDGKIDWNEPAEKIFRKWRAYHPWPGIYTLVHGKGAPKRLKILEISADTKKNTHEKTGKIIELDGNIAVQTGKGLIVVKKVQFEGKKEMDIDDFLRGRKYFLNAILS